MKNIAHMPEGSPCHITNRYIGLETIFFRKKIQLLPFKKTKNFVKDGLRLATNKYVLAGTLASGAAKFANSQDFDFSKHTIFDPYSLVDTSKTAYGGVDFHNMSAAEKDAFYQERIRANGVRYIEGYTMDWVSQEVMIGG